MSTPIILLGAGALLLAGTLRLATHLRSPSPGARYLGLASAASGTALLLNAPEVYTWCDQAVFKGPNDSALASYLLTLGAAAAAVEMVAGLQPRRLSSRWVRRAGLVVVASAMVVTFLHGAPTREAPAFFDVHRDDPRLGAFWAIFCSSVALAATYIALVVARAARHDRGPVARGLRLIAAGVGCVAIFLVVCLLRVTLPSLSAPSGTPVLVVGGTLLGVGLLWPQCATALERAAARRRLRPLWAAVTARYPHVCSSTDRPSLYRTVIEIQDAVAEARAHHEIDSPLLRALDDLAVRPAEEFEATVADLIHATTVPHLVAR